MKQEGKRPLLLLDNVDIILGGLKEKQWSLRRVLQESGGIVVVGASAGPLEAATRQDAAFYDFFQVDVLEKLPLDEVASCLRRLAGERSDAGRMVLEVLDRDPARVHVLYDLTGGNPRTLAMLYPILELRGDGDVMRDLESLLDQATPLYKARVEELPPQARVVFDAVALAWDPVTAAEVGVASGLEVGTASAQLDRLVKDGMVEKATLSTTNRTAFQVAERFFNIWYLMRHGPRRQRTRLRWLTEVLRRIYSPVELRDYAAALLGSEGGQHADASYCLALSDALEDRELGEALRQRYGDPSEISPRGREAARESLRPEELEAALRKAIELDPKDARNWSNLGIVLEGQLGRYEETESAYRKAIELDPKEAAPWYNLGVLLGGPLRRYEEAEDAYRKAIEVDPKYVRAWNNLGVLLEGPLERYEEAESAYRKAIEFAPKEALPWNNLGIVLGGPLARYEEAEDAYRKAIELDPKYAGPWYNLGVLLGGPLGRYEEAEGAYRKTVELDPKDADPWHNLGVLLGGSLGRYEEAEGAYKKAIELDPNDALTWNNLGNLLAGPRGRYGEAEAAYRRSIELEPETSAFPAANLAYLLLSADGREDEAEQFYRTAIRLLPPHGAGVLRAFYALAHDNFGAATSELGQVLEQGHEELLSVYRDDLLRVLVMAAARGYGDKLLDWFDSTRLGDRYWPLRAAFYAYLDGEARLMEVNPEVRSGARRLLTEMNSLRRKRDAAPAPTNTKPRRRSRSSRTPKRTPRGGKRS